MTLIRCQKIRAALECTAATYGWEDYVYHFCQNRDWTDPEATYVCEASPTMQTLLVRYKDAGLQSNRFKYGALQNDEPRIYRLDDLKYSASAKEREVHGLFTETGLKSVLSFSLYGHGGALGIIGLYSVRERIPEDMAEATVNHLSPRFLQFNAWSRALVENAYAATYDLTPRELECMRLVAEGKTSKEIARILRITSRTVDFHVQNATDKLGATSRSQAAWRLSMIPSNSRLDDF